MASRCRTTPRCSEEMSHLFSWKQQQVPPRLRLGPLASTPRAKTQWNISGTKAALRLPVSQGSQGTTNQLPTARAAPGPEKDAPDAPCRNPGSNQGPLDLQSNALPTELFRLQRLPCCLRPCCASQVEHAGVLNMPDDDIHAARVS